MLKQIAVGGMVVAAALGTAGVAAASGGGGESAQAGGSTARSFARTTAVPGLTKCDGGAQKATYNRIVNEFTIVPEGPDVTLPGTDLVVKGPARGRDTLNVTFSTEDQLRGNASHDEFDWAELEVWVDGRPIQPFGPSSSPMAVTGSPTYAMNAAQFCTRVGPGLHRIKVVTRVVDNGNDDALSAWFDDYDLRVEQAD
jgi:hypothetical protein